MYIVIFGDGNEMKFIAHPEQKLYVHVLGDNYPLSTAITPSVTSAIISPVTPAATSLVSVAPVTPAATSLVTVAENESRFSRREVIDANLALDFQKKMAYASSNDVIEMLNRGSVMNLPITSKSMRNANAIHGTATAILKGKEKHHNASVHAEEPSATSNLIDIDQDQDFHSDLFL